MQIVNKRSMSNPAIQSTLMKDEKADVLSVYITLTLYNPGSIFPRSIVWRTDRNELNESVRAPSELYTEMAEMVLSNDHRSKNVVAGFGPR